MKLTTLSVTLSCLLYAGSAAAASSDPWTDPSTRTTWSYAGIKSFADAELACSRRGAQLADFQSLMTALRNGMADRTRNTLWRDGDFNVLEFGPEVIWTTATAADPQHGVVLNASLADSDWPKTEAAHTVCLGGGGGPGPVSVTQTVFACRGATEFFNTGDGGSQFTQFICGTLVKPGTASLTPEEQSEVFQRGYESCLEGSAGLAGNPFRCEPIQGQCFSVVSHERGTTDVPFSFFEGCSGARP
jgi:hypothetical protein